MSIWKLRLKAQKETNLKLKNEISEAKKSGGNSEEMINEMKVKDE
jgi:hypothetical protein